MARKSPAAETCQRIARTPAPCARCGKAASREVLCYRPGDRTGEPRWRPLCIEHNPFSPWNREQAAEE